MTAQVSNALKGILLSPFPDTFNAGFIDVYAGTQPLTSDIGADPGDYLGTITYRGLPREWGTPAGLTFSQAGPYILKPYTDLWQLSVANSGTATWFRLVTANDDGTETSLTWPRLDGAIANVSGGGELILPSLSLTAGDVVSPLSFFVTIPPLLGA
jgi:hypothetical protein